MRSLKLIRDRDAEEDFEGLTVMVDTDLPIEDALSHLAAFDEQYWLDQAVEVRRRLNVMVVPE
jgi:hypothetical protein